MTSPALAKKYDGLLDGLPENLRLRLGRAISWVERAERDSSDFDAAFVFYWIALNAACAEDRPEGYERTEAEVRNRFLGQVLQLDGGRRVQPVMWRRLSAPIRSLIGNRFVFQPYWKHHNLVPGHEDWEGLFQRSQEIANNALERGDTLAILRIVFDRLYVLRNQLLHGGSTYSAPPNRTQVQAGALIMAFLVPLFIDLMLEHPHSDWGSPYYPPVVVDVEEEEPEGEEESSSPLG